MLSACSVSFLGVQMSGTYQHCFHPSGQSRGAVILTYILHMKKRAPRQVTFLFFLSLGKDLNPVSSHPQLAWQSSDLELYKTKTKQNPNKPTKNTPQQLQRIADSQRTQSNCGYHTVDGGAAQRQSCLARARIQSRAPCWHTLKAVVWGHTTRK